MRPARCGTRGRFAIRSWLCTSSFGISLTPALSRTFSVFKLKVGDEVGDSAPAIEWTSVHALSHLRSADDPRVDTDRNSARAILDLLTSEDEPELYDRTVASSGKRWTGMCAAATCGARRRCSCSGMTARRLIRYGWPVSIRANSRPSRQPLQRHTPPLTPLGSERHLRECTGQRHVRAARGCRCPRSVGTNVPGMTDGPAGATRGVRQMRASTVDAVWQVFGVAPYRHRHGPPALVAVAGRRCPTAERLGP